MEAKRLAEALERMKGRFGWAYDPEEAKIIYRRCRNLTDEELDAVVSRVFAAGCNKLPSLTVWRESVAYVRPHTPSPEEKAPDGPRVKRNAVREARDRICEGMKAHRPGKEPIGNRTESEIEAEVRRLTGKADAEMRGALVALRWVIGGQRQTPSEYFSALREASRA